MNKRYFLYTYTKHNDNVDPIVIFIYQGIFVLVPNKDPMYYVMISDDSDGSDNIYGLRTTNWSEVDVTSSPFIKEITEDEAFLEMV